MSRPAPKAWALAVATAVCLSAAEARAGALQAPGCLDGGEPATIKSISDALEPLLDDGTVVKLPGIEPVGAEAEMVRIPARAALSAWLAGRTIRVRSVLPDPDRWGRRVALVFAPAPGADPAAGSVSLGEALLDAGLARARPNPAIAPCWTRYLALEAGARQAVTGLWAEPADQVIDAGDTAKLGRATGRLAVVEGRILRDRPSGARRLLLFTEQGRNGFAVAIEGNVEKRSIPAREITGWIGRRVRVRGFLDDRFGFQIELTTRDQLEFIDP